MLFVIVLQVRVQADNSSECLSGWVTSLVHRVPSACERTGFAELATVASPPTARTADWDKLSDPAGSPAPPLPRDCVPLLPPSGGTVDL